LGAYRFVEDLVSDVMFEAEGETLSALIEQSALAMFSVICDLEAVNAELSFELEARANDPKSLLFLILARLLTESEIRGLFLSQFEAKTEEAGGEFTCILRARGEKASPRKGGTVVKGIVYYGFSVEKTGPGYTARVAMDV
jgi:SHS2 domain-containing protein